MNIFYLVKYHLSKINLHFLSLSIITIVALIVTYSNLGLTKEFIGDDAGVGYHYPQARLDMAYNMWNSSIFPGESDTVGTISLIHISSINILNKLGFSSIFIDRFYYFLFYFVSGIGMYFLSCHICNILTTVGRKSIWTVSLIGAVFYMLNNFTMILLSFPPTSYVYSYMFLPWIFFFYLKDFHVSNNLWHKLIFVITFILLSSGNPSNTIIIIILLLMYELFFRENNKIFNNLNKFFPTLLLLLLISSFIYFPILGNKGNPYGNVSSSDNKVSIVFSSAKTSIENLLILRGHHSQDTFIFNKFLLSDSVIIANYILLIIAFYFLLKKKKSRLELFLLSTFVIFLFLAKAEHAPLEWLNRLIYNNVPLFEMYRASYFKFEYYCIFAVSLLLPISLLKIDDKFLRFNFSLTKKTIIVCTSLLVLFCAKPFFYGEVARDIHKTTIPNEYHDTEKYLNNIKTDFSVLSLPQLSFNLTLDWGNGNYYGGGQPDMFFLGKPVWSNGWFLPENQISNQLNFYKDILYRSNIKYILLHKDIPENFYFDVNITGNLKGQTDYNELNNQILSDNNFKLIQNNKFFKVFEINNEQYNPHLFIPKKSIISKQSPEDWLKILSQEDGGIHSAVFLTGQNLGKDDILKQVADNTITPVVEFKKINPTKYRVKIHSANGQFPLVFSESFHEGWKAYLTPVKSGEAGLPLAEFNGVNKYKILDGNSDDQASKEELASFIDKGLVSTLGDGSNKTINHMKWDSDKQKEVPDYIEKYNIDFISKNFQDTIQNDNLPNGNIFETWFPKNAVQLPETNHLMANGYVNSWVIDAEKLCSENKDFCIKNPDGTYDMELVVEFWPQRLFYIGLFISGTTLVLCLSYLGYDFIKKRKEKSLEGARMTLGK